MSTADSGQDVWARLRVICQDGHFKRYPPATEEQLRATEERLGFPLPSDLRRLYREVANGGLYLGIAHVFHGAIGGCGEYADVRSDGRTIEALRPHGGWRLHPRMEGALLRNPGYYVVAESSPEDFLWIAEDSEISVEINIRTGRIYNTEYWGEIPVPLPENSASESLICMELVAPSQANWFERWLDRSWVTRPYGRELLPEMVETGDLPDPDIVWRGLYRFGPGWWARPDDADDEDSLSRYPPEN